LELGGKNAAIVLQDADLDLAAASVADAMCLTAGQRCNATSRIIVDARVEAEFVDLLRAKLCLYTPGDPTLASTKLGPLVSQAARDRYAKAIEQNSDWLVRGEVVESADGKHGYYVTPAVMRISGNPQNCELFMQELFAPVAVLAPVRSDDEAITLNALSDFGLTTSVFTQNRERFLRLANDIHCGNVYLNLPTTFSPGTLPFGGLRDSGNRHPGGRGFIRFASDEQVLQMKA